MMKQALYVVKSNDKIADCVYRLKLAGDVSEITAPGQFVNITVPDCYLRRPISVADFEEGELTLIYKVVGKGTDVLSKMKEGDMLDILVGLGNGYDLDASGEKPLLIGGGVGVPPLYKLCKELVAQGKKPTVVLGFGSKNEVFYQEEFEALGAKVIVTTVDGSLGVKGFVTDAIKNLEYTYFYACGPMPMFRAIESMIATEGEYSMEERMGCGFGACMGCSLQTKNGAKRVCKEGPVFKRRELIW